MADKQTIRKILVEDTSETATELVAELFKAAVCQAIHDAGACYLALAGGTTPHALYKQLAASCTREEVPWNNVQVFFGDERDVPQDDVESNYHMVQKTLLDHVPVPPTHVHPMPADRANLSTAAAEYEQVIRRIVPLGAGGTPQFDLILLGMGGDGHTASLFPGAEALQEQKKLVTAYHVPVLGRQRMTFTLPLINAARGLILLITGADKAEAVAKLLGDNPAAREDLPAARLAPQGPFMIVLDAAAARRTGLKHT